MALRRSPSRLPLALAFFIALSGACGGGDDEGVPAEYETTPGPNIPQPPAERSLVAEGEVEVTPATGQASAVVLVTKVSSNNVFNGKESGFSLRMACGASNADIEIAMYFPDGDEIIRVELQNDRWLVNGRVAEVVPAKPQSADAGADDAGGDAGGDDAGDAAVDASTAPPPADPSFVNGVGFPGTDGRREVSVTLVADGVRYDIHATIPWLASNAPATCQKLKPGTGTSGSSSGGCGSKSGSRRSSGGDWD